MRYKMNMLENIKYFYYIFIMKIKEVFNKTIHKPVTIEREEPIIRINQIVSELKKANKANNSDKYSFSLLEELEEIINHEIKVVYTILDSIDDMIWAKRTDGTYILTNKAFREEFCYGLTNSEILGKNDVYLAARFKGIVGNKNHTFGEVCKNSDVVIIDTKKSQKFLEHGLIKGNMFKLMVNKTPVFQDNKLIAVTGVGKNVTEWHNALENALKADNSCFNGTKSLVLDELNKYVFK